MIGNENIRAELCEGSVLDLPYAAETFDCVVSMSVLEHVRDLDRAFEEIRRVTKKYGAIVLGFPVKNILSESILKISYLLLHDVKLEEEHVSTHFQILEKGSGS